MIDILHTEAPIPLPLSFGVSWWVVIRPDGTWRVLWSGKLHSLRNKAKARKATGEGGDGGSVA